MVGIATGLGRTGFQDWLIQRVTAVILVVYTVFLFGFILNNPGMNYETWVTLFRWDIMKLATFLALLCMVAHAWVGLWTVSTDYIKVSWLRILFQLVINLGLLGLLTWGIKILWSV